ncbi:MAG: PIN domain-containing protein [Limisphaerales bacterium]
MARPSVRTIVLDTNTFIAAGWRVNTHARRVFAAVARRRFRLAVTSAMLDEYRGVALIFFGSAAELDFAQESACHGLVSGQIEGRYQQELAAESKAGIPATCRVLNRKLLIIKPAWRNWQTR